MGILPQIYCIVSGALYEELGFRVFDGDGASGWLIMQNDSSTIGLFQEMFDRNIGPAGSISRCCRSRKRTSRWVTASKPRALEYSQSMPGFRKYTVSIAVAASLLIAIAASTLLTGDHPFSQPAERQSSGSGAEESAAESGSGADPMRGETEGMDVEVIAEERTGGRIVEAPDTRTEKQGLTPAQADKLADRVGKEIESALKGNVDDAMSFATFARGCEETHDSESDLRHKLSVHELHSDGMLPELGLLGMRVYTDSFEAWSARQWRRFHECQSTRSLLNEDLRSRLKALAERGNVTARFMYAVWPPIQYRYTPEGMLLYLEYIDAAYAFSVQNLTDAPALGLLALGLSFGGFVEGFTPQDPNLGQVHVIAAVRCGASEAILNELLRALAAAIQTQYFDQQLEHLWSMSDGLVSAHCE